MQLSNVQMEMKIGPAAKLSTNSAAQADTVVSCGLYASPT
jgi:hypothetical protein